MRQRYRTAIAFPGHAGRCWPLARWRSLAPSHRRTINELSTELSWSWRGGRSGVGLVVGAQRYGDGVRLAVTLELDGHLVTGLVTGDQLRQVFGPIDRVIVDVGDHVSLLDAGL